MVLLVPGVAYKVQHLPFYLSQGREREYKNTLVGRGFLHDKFQSGDHRSALSALLGGENTEVCVSCGEKEREKIEREKRMEERV